MNSNLSKRPKSKRDEIGCPPCKIQKVSHNRGKFGLFPPRAWKYYSSANALLGTEDVDNSDQDAYSASEPGSSSPRSEIDATDHRDAQPSKDPATVVQASEQIYFDANELPSSCVPNLAFEDGQILANVGLLSIYR